MPHLWRPVAVLVVVAAMATAACSSSGSKGTATPGGASTTVGPERSASPTTAVNAPTTAVNAPTAPAGTAITIQGFAFQPVELQAKAGDTITVTNSDGTDHSLTAVDGSFDTGRFSGGTKTFKVDKAGRFEFKCEVHSFMPHGFIQVSG